MGLGGLDAMRRTRAAEVSHCKASKLRRMPLRGASAMLVLLAAIGLAAEAYAQYPGGQGGTGGRADHAVEWALGAARRRRSRCAAGRRQEVPAFRLVRSSRYSSIKLEDDLSLSRHRLAPGESTPTACRNWPTHVTQPARRPRLSTPALTSAVQQLDQIAARCTGRMSAVDEIVDSGRTLLCDAHAGAEGHRRPAACRSS